MHLALRDLWLPKRGNTPEEFEDAFSPVSTASVATGLYRCAVADGATETSFSGSWARMLVDAYAAGALSVRKRQETLQRLRDCWRDVVRSRPLPWYAEEKARQGAFSTLLGLTVLGRRREEGAWNAVAVGDSCLLQVRAGALLEAFPLRDSAEFNSRPILLPSTGPGAVPDFARRAGRWVRGDVFYLMTDALAAWSLREWERGVTPWCELDALTEDSFPNWTAERRSSGSMRNDDVTLVRLEMV